jgi:uncharacterized protein YbaA (DUF1428 family)
VTYRDGGAGKSAPIGTLPMAFLALSRQGVDAYEALGCPAGALWLAAGVLSADELAALRLRHGSITDFNYPIDPNDQKVVSGAVETIKEHHPGEPVWVEA